MKIPRSLSLERKRRAWEMHQKFFKHHEIAEALGMKLSAVSRMLGRLNKSFRESLAADIEETKIRQIAQLEHLAREAYEAWERSKEAAKSVMQRKNLIQGQAVGGVEQTNVARDQDGDPRYLKECRECLEAIRKIIGADAPLKLQHSGEKDADAIKLDIASSKEQFLAELASLTGQIPAVVAGGEVQP